MSTNVLVKRYSIHTWQYVYRGMYVCINYYYFGILVKSWTNFLFLILNKEI